MNKKILTLVIFLIFATFILGAVTNNNINTMPNSTITTTSPINNSNNSIAKAPNMQDPNQAIRANANRKLLNKTNNKKQATSQKTTTESLNQIMDDDSGGMLISLKDAINFGTLKSYSALININTKAQLQLNRSVLFKKILPSLNANSSFSKYQADNSPLANWSQNNVNYDPRYKLGPNYTPISNNVSVNQTIFDAGTFWGIAGALSSKGMAQNQYDSSQAELILEIISQYIATLKTMEQERIYFKNLKIQIRDYNKSLVMYRMKMIAKSDLYNMKYQLASAKAQMINIKNQVLENKIQLKNLLKMDPNTKIQLSMINVNQKVLDIGKRNLKDDINQATTNSSFVKYIQKNFQVEKDTQLGGAFSNILPTVSLGYDYGSKGETFNTSTSHWNWRMTLSASLPLWNWGENFDMLGSAEKSVNTSELNMNQQIDGLRANLERNYNSIIELQELKSAYAIKLESAEQSFAAHNQRYLSGLCTSTELLKSEVQFLNSEIEYANNNLDLYFASRQYLLILKYGCQPQFGGVSAPSMIETGSLGDSNS